MSQSSIQQKHSQYIKNQAKDLGFMSCGISKAEFLEEEAPRLENWLREGMQGKMSYMERNFDKRLDPSLLVPGAKSVVSLLFNYFPENTQNAGAPKISKYAYGEDYHFVMKDRLRELLDRIREEVGDVNGRCFVDSAPVLDKAWAAKSGLGWIGKNSNLLSKKVGSFFFIAELIIDLELKSDGPMTDHCGTCTMCIEACPTDAIVQPFVVDGSKCISYFTIELKDAIPEEMKGRFDDWAFGCDICQDVCPWNRFSTPHKEERISISQPIADWTEKNWMEMTEEVFTEVFKDSPLSRTGFQGMKRNLNFLD